MKSKYQLELEHNKNIKLITGYFGKHAPDFENSILINSEVRKHDNLEPTLHETYFLINSIYGDLNFEVRIIIKKIITDKRFSLSVDERNFSMITEIFCNSNLIVKFQNDVSFKWRDFINPNGESDCILDRKDHAKILIDNSKNDENKIHFQNLISLLEESNYQKEKQSKNTIKTMQSENNDKLEEERNDKIFALLKDK